MGRVSTLITLFIVSLVSALGCGGGGGMGGAPGAACVPFDDRNPCTDDVCDNDQRVHKPAAAGTPCLMGGAKCDGLGNCAAPACNGVLGLPGLPSPQAGLHPVSV